MKASLIRPGLLVSFKTTVRGGVTYDKREIEAEHSVDTGALVARWETTREIADPAEHEAAISTRSKIRVVLLRHCCVSSFGYLCPEPNEARLAEAIEEAQRLADEHNGKARSTRVEFGLIMGRIADSDEQAVRAIGGEVRDLIEAMERGVRAADPDAIREAANRARAVAGMLSPDAQRKVSDAIKEVRSIAREIVRRVEKAGETAAQVVDGVKLDALTAARFAVLDIEPAAQQPDDDGFGFPVLVPALDLAPLEASAPPAAPVQPITFDFDLDN